jgi:hypothetical protein
MLYENAYINFDEGYNGPLMEEAVTNNVSSMV